MADDASRRCIHVVDDDETIRRSLAFMLKTSGYRVRCWSSGAAFLKEARQLEPGCILLDIRMPDMDGLEVQAELARRGIALPVVIVTGHGDIAIAVRAMKAGAVDFIEKPFQKEVLLTAIENALERLASADDRAEHAAEARTILAALTSRERQVLEGLTQGSPNKTIAFDLGISPRTVEVHRANLMAKLHVHSLSDALRIAFAAGIGG